MKRLKKLLKKSKNIALISHVSPDPDTIGSTLALKKILEAKNINISILVDSEKNFAYDFLDDYKFYKFDTTYNFLEFDKIIFVDVPTASKLGCFENLINFDVETIRIDHHINGDNFAKHNFVKPYSACAILIFELANILKVNITPEIATYLYFAICGDTGVFKNSNTDSLTFSICSKLIDFGANMHKIYSEFFEKKTVTYLKLSSFALLNAKTNDGFGFAIMSLSANDYQQFDASENESVGNLPNLYLACGYKIAAILKETNDGIRCSLRCKPAYDCSKIAEQFGGGGHKNASGCNFDCSLECAVTLLEQSLLNYLQNFN